MEYADNYCVTAKKLILNVSKIRLRLIFSCALYLPRLFQKRIVLKNSPRRIKSGTDADGSKQKRVYFTLPASTPPVSKKAYFKKTNKKNILKNTYCKKHSIQLFYKQLSPITHTDRKKRYSVSYVFYIGMSFRIGTIQSKKQNTQTLNPPGFPKGCPLWQREEKGGGHRGTFPLNYRRHVEASGGK